MDEHQGDGVQPIADVVGDDRDRDDDPHRRAHLETGADPDAVQETMLGVGEGRQHANVRMGPRRIHDLMGVL